MPRRILPIQPNKEKVENLQTKYFLAAFLSHIQTICSASFDKLSKQISLKLKYQRAKRKYFFQSQAAGMNVFCRPAANFLKAIISLSLEGVMKGSISQLAMSWVANAKIVCSWRRIKKISGYRKTKQLSYDNRRIILIVRPESLYQRKQPRCCLELIMMVLLQLNAKKLVKIILLHCCFVNFLDRIVIKPSIFAWLSS